MTTLRRIGLMLFAALLGLGLVAYTRLSTAIIHAEGWWAAVFVLPVLAVVAVFAYKLVGDVRESHWHRPTD